MALLAAGTVAFLQLWLLARAQSYLDGERRPLWILEDELTKRQRLERPEEDYATTTRQPLLRRQGRGGLASQVPAPITFLVRHEEEPRPRPRPRTAAPSLPQRRFMMPHRLQLPHQYVQPQKPLQRRESRRQLPVFDNAPGDNVLRSGGDSNYPIFVYNGTRGELILNTMLSRRRYPMQEPVPGQVLYPPSTPMFRPKPIVERFRLPGHREAMNLTLIPFYAHEAIASPSARTLLTTTSPPPVVTATPLYETQLPRIQESQNRRPKKAKQYEAFHSPQEVMQWQTVMRRRNHNGKFSNHRAYASEELDLDVEMALDSEEASPEWEEAQEVEAQEEEAQLELEEKDAASQVEMPAETTTSEGPFQIVYLDESLERPVVESLESGATSTTTLPPVLRQSSRYALKREYYAFPVYTLGKLLQPQIQSKTPKEKTDRVARNSAEKEPNSTWFILNSRYKGPHHRRLDNHTKYYTSKYIGNAFRPR
ncbi:hypothetical protein KR018_000273 [Drosophila ironensis]|nr:hypothetical protein KR018_000273 [Drosophila ironensis]